MPWRPRGEMTPRNPTTVFLLSIVLPVAYVVYWAAATGNELRGQGAEVPPWWYLLVPVLGFVYLWKLGAGIERVAGTENAATLALLCIFLPPIGMFLAQKTINGRALRAATA